MNPALLDIILGGFSPTQISGLALWLDAADAATITLDGSNNVSEWRDKSGFARHFSRDFVTQRPAYSLASINGLNSVYYDGVSDVLITSPGSWAYSYPVNVFVVFRAVAFTPAYASLWDFYGDPSGTVGSHTGLIKSNGKSSIYAAATNATNPNYDGTGALTYSTGVNNLFSAVIGDNSITSRGNQATDGSTTGTWTLRTTAALSIHEIGASSKFTRYNEWRIGEFLMYTGGALSTGNRDAVEAYLKTKWSTP